MTLSSKDIANADRIPGGGTPFTKAQQTRRRRSRKSKAHPEGWDSQEEYDYYCQQLRVRERAGDISNLLRHVVVPLHVGRRYMRLDFSYWCHQRECQVWEDYKPANWKRSPMYKDWRTKLDIWVAGFGPGLLLVTTPAPGGYHSTEHPVKPKAEALRNILRAAYATMNPEVFGQILSEGKDADEQDPKKKS